MNPLGASLRDDGVTFRVWAPKCRSVEDVVEGRSPERLHDVGEGILELSVPDLAAGTRYQYRRDGDACHAHGRSVFLDVVYNHLGPEGNYLAEYGPYFTDRYKTPWGSAVNFDGADSAGVRRHFSDNARHWVREFHVDGLRLDAVHSIFDASPLHILTEITEAAREEGRRLGR